MLTKDDLKQIRGVVREEVTTETEDLKDRFDSELKLTRVRLENSIGNLSNKVKDVEISVNHLSKDIKKLQKDVKGTINMSDKGLLSVQTRVRKLEAKANLPVGEFA